MRKAVGEDAESGPDLEYPFVRTYLRVSYDAIGDTVVDEKILTFAALGDDPRSRHEFAGGAHLETKM